MAFKLCMDVHIVGKNTLGLYRSLLSFTNALIMCTGTKFELNENSFADPFSYLGQIAGSANYAVSDDSDLFCDFMSLP